MMETHVEILLDEFTSCLSADAQIVLEAFDIFVFISSPKLQRRKVRKNKLSLESWA